MTWVFVHVKLPWKYLHLWILYIPSRWQNSVVLYFLVILPGLSFTFSSSFKRLDIENRQLWMNLSLKLLWNFARQHARVFKNAFFAEFEQRITCKGSIALGYRGFLWVLEWFFVAFVFLWNFYVLYFNFKLYVSMQIYRQFAYTFCFIRKPFFLP